MAATTIIPPTGANCVGRIFYATWKVWRGVTVERGYWVKGWSGWPD
ncbi:MAG: hypothetical protein L0Y58_04730 [Verrucomicrobia subdivision 3 bacterium]|nr:hypothetical protein [Limisphaerales bacterium]